MIYWLTSLVALLGVWLNIHGHVACFYLWMLTNFIWAIADWQHGLPQQASLQAVRERQARLEEATRVVQSTGGDRVEISERAQALADEDSSRTSQAVDREARRTERLQELRQRFESGRLNTPEAIDRAASRLLGA